MVQPALAAGTPAPAGGALDHVAKQLWVYRGFIPKAAARNCMALEHLPKELRLDKDITEKAVHLSWEAPTLLHEDLQRQYSLLPEASLNMTIDFDEVTPVAAVRTTGCRQERQRT